MEKNKAAAHTPGPWGWGYTTHNTGTGAMEGDLQLVTRMPNPKLNDPVILTVREDWKGFLTRAPEGIANATLIALAPEMFSFLELVIVEAGAHDPQTYIEFILKEAIKLRDKIEGTK